MDKLGKPGRSVLSSEQQERSLAAPQKVADFVLRSAPGVALCVTIAILAMTIQAVQARVIGRAYFDAIVVAILLGTLIRSNWSPASVWLPGIALSSKTLLEIAVVLLGASISFDIVMQAGLGLIAGIAIVVFSAIVTSYGICSLLGLPWRMGMLIACGNSICGNSAIAAVAPIIGAKSEDVVASIAFTAVVGVILVLCLPMLVPVLQLSEMQYGVLAGLTVYAVPQVLAATIPVSIVSTQLGTLVKLVRVLMLGPLVLLLSLGAGLAKDSKSRVSIKQLVPWFIIGFIALSALRSFDAISDSVLSGTVPVATTLTIISMAGLGLGVDVRVLSRVGARVILAVTLSLSVLIAISFGLIRWLSLA